MKLAIIAAAILSSSAAFAGTGHTANTANLYFGATQEASCAMRVITDNAPISFDYNEAQDKEHYTQVDLRSDFARKMLVTADGGWTDSSAWNGGKPATTLHITTEGAIGNSGTTHEGMNYQNLFVMNGEAAQESSFFMGVQAENMTHAGSARFDAVVQFECE